MAARAPAALPLSIDCSAIARPAGRSSARPADDERGGGVEHDDVAVGAAVAVEHPPHDVGVVLRVAADQLVVGGRRQAERDRVDGERAGAAVVVQGEHGRRARSW